MKRMIIDSRIRKQEYDYLSQNFEIIKMPVSNDVYDEISGHSDIFYCKIDNQIICAPNAPIIESDYVIGNNKVEREYPKDVFYNTCQIGKNIIGSEFTDSSIKPNILVRQRYTKCSIAVTSNNSCITTDKWIAKKLQMYGIDALYINENKINLMDKHGNISKLKGFIGGASFVFENKFVLFGDSKELNNRNAFLEHLKRYNLELAEFENLPILDYGGGIVLK